MWDPLYLSKLQASTDHAKVMRPTHISNYNLIKNSQYMRNSKKKYVFGVISCCTSKIIQNIAQYMNDSFFFSK